MSRTLSCRHAYYDFDLEEWVEDTNDVEYDFDTIFDDAQYQPGTITIAWWDPQRGAYVPAGNPMGIRGYLDGALASGGTAVVSITEPFALPIIVAFGGVTSSFRVEGDFASKLRVGDTVRVEDSTNYDGVYVIKSGLSYDAATNLTEIPIEENITTGGVSDGTLYFWSDEGNDLTVEEVVGAGSNIPSGNVVWCEWCMKKHRYVVTAAEC